VRPLLSLLLLIVSVIAALVVRARVASTTFGRRRAYDRPIGDSIAVVVLAAGGGVAAFVTGVTWLGSVLLGCGLVLAIAVRTVSRPEG
jgi:hypothetical protein